MRHLFDPDLNQMSVTNVIILTCYYFFEIFGYYFRNGWAYTIAVLVELCISFEKAVRGDIVPRLCLYEMFYIGVVLHQSFL